jgi:D-cysteine desulfhydrase
MIGEEPMDTRWPERISLAHLPTPVQRVGALSARLGRDVYVKRDDLTECAASGNKIRKLEFLLAEARSLGAEVVITAGGLQSNHCRATAVACRTLGLLPHLVLAGEEPARPRGNLYIDRLMDARITFAGPGEYAGGAVDLMASIAATYRKEGRKAYVIPVGGSTPLGCLGYVRCAEEIAAFFTSEKVSPARIYHAAGSGGTTSGLVLGAELSLPGTRVVGINVGEEREPFLREIRSIMTRAAGEFSLPLSRSAEDLPFDLVEGYFGKGYGDTWPGLEAFLRETARTTGLVLDPVYTGKALLGMVGEEEKRKDGDPVLFIHTGGIFSLMA